MWAPPNWQLWMRLPAIANSTISRRFGLDQADAALAATIDREVVTGILLPGRSSV